MNLLIRVSFFIMVSASWLQAQSDTLDSTLLPVTIYEHFFFFLHLLHQENDTTYIINFWATWCGPCVKELPYFEQLHEKYAGEKISIILVSLDFPKQIKSKLLPFIEKNQLKSKVVVLTDGAFNDWIDKVDPSWDGAIPITLVYQAEKRKLTLKEFENFNALDTIVEQFINH